MNQALSEDYTPSCRKSLLQGWLIFHNNWRPMFVYSFVIWACSSIILTPLTVWILHNLAGFGDVIVGNYKIHLWLLTPRGVTFLLLAGALFLFTFFIHITGLLKMSSVSNKDDLSVKGTLLEVLRASPSLLRLGLGAFIVYLPVFLIIAIGPAFSKFVCLAKHDINYYLTHRPLAWFIAIAVSAVWVLPLLCGAVYLTVRWIYTLPCWLDGGRPLKRVLHKSWHATKGRFWHLFRIIFSCVLICASTALILEFLVFVISKSLLLYCADSFRRTVWIASGYVMLSAAIDSIVGFVLMAWSASVLQISYKADVHNEQQISTVTSNKVRLNLIEALLKPSRLRIAFTALGAVVVISWGLTILTYSQKIPEKRTTIIAHRAGPVDAPENSLSGLKIVLQDKAADIVEIDVTITKDGELVVAHDKDLMKQAKDPRVIRETDYEDISDVDIGSSFHPSFKEERLGRLDDFLKLAKGRMPMILEFKHGKGTNLVEKTINTVREHNMQDEVILMSLELEEVRLVQKLAPEIKVGYFASIEMGDLTELDVYSIGTKDRLNKPDFVEELQEEGMLVYAWTIDDIFRMVELIEAGVDGIITNDPRTARMIANRVHGLHPTARLLLRFRRLWGVFDELGWWSTAPVSHAAK